MKQGSKERVRNMRIVTRTQDGCRVERFQAQEERESQHGISAGVQMGLWETGNDKEERAMVT